MQMGHLNIVIDQLVPCLIDTRNGQQVKTIVMRMSRLDLRGYNSRTGWYVNWEKLSGSSEVYAVQVAGSFEIEGLIALHEDKDAKAIIIDWAVANPHNNPQMQKDKRYVGVGGHLFAIAVNTSFERGYGGVILGHPSNKEIMQHYISVLYAEPFPFPSGYAYTIVIWEQAAQEIQGRYTYEKAE